MSDGDIDIRPMTAADIPFGMELKNAVGWNQLPGDWQRLINLEPDGCFVATCDGESVGTATSTAYEDKFGWVAMVLVHPDHRRKGIGSALLYACIDYLEERVATVKLDATPMGKKLYDTLGFVDEYMMERWLGKGSGRGEVQGVEPITPELLPAVCEFDSPVFGADRSRLIGMLVEEEPNTAVCVRSDDAVVGYGVLRPGYHTSQIGPLVAADVRVAERLYSALLGAAGNEHVINDIVLPNHHVAEMLSRKGFEKQRYLIRMYKGQNKYPGHPEYVYAACGPEKG